MRINAGLLVYYSCSTLCLYLSWITTLTSTFKCDCANTFRTDGFSNEFNYPLLWWIFICTGYARAKEKMFQPFKCMRVSSDVADVFGVTKIILSRNKASCSTKSSIPQWNVAFWVRYMSRYMYTCPSFSVFFCERIIQACKSCTYLGYMAAGNKKYLELPCENLES